MELKKNTFGNSSDNDDVPEEIEHNLIKDSVLELVKSDFKEDIFEDLPVGDIRKNVSDCEFAGKPVSRKNFEERNWIEENASETDNSDNDTLLSETDNSDNDILQDDVSQDDNVQDNISGSDYDDDMSGQDENNLEASDEEEGSEIESEEEASDSKSNIVQSMNIFSKKIKDTQSDIDKGNSIKDQLFVWENLIESRIKLQRGLTCCNSLFQKDDLTKFITGLDKDERSVVEITQKTLIELLEALIQVQASLLQVCPEYTNSKEGMEKEYDDEELDDSESGTRKRKKEGVNNVGKKRKVIQDYAEYLTDIDEQFKPFRNSVIQKWNEKTRLAAGKMGISKFAILEQSTIKQIEQMLSDKDRLIKRTQINRSNQQVLGKEVDTENPEDNLEENLGEDRNDKLKNLDDEIFDDSDFYHKLLKDFIDRKTSDITDPTKLGRQWTQLQKLRSKMKHKVDTRATKGRRLRYTVHNKLVNFMAPITYSTWDEKVESDLFRSLFGKASQVMPPLDNTKS